MSRNAPGFRPRSQIVAEATAGRELAKVSRAKTPKAVSEPKPLEEQVRDALGLGGLPYFILTSEQARQIANLYGQLDEVDRLILFPLFTELTYLRDLAESRGGQLNALRAELNAERKEASPDGQ